MPFPTADVPVHDIIAATVQRQPGAPVTCAWDGNWTYAKLYAVSTRLARALWPSRRLTNQAIFAEYEGLAEATTATLTNPLPEVEAWPRLHVVFTSGTNSVPKEVMVSHSNFSFALRDLHGTWFTANAQVVDSASYAFDVALSNVLCALECGGCLCIPSDDERRDDLPGVEKAESSEHIDPSKFLSTSGVSNDLTFWKFDESVSNTTSDHEMRSIDIDEHTTSLLLKDSNAALDSTPVDLLLSAVWAAFLSVFKDREGLTIFNEGHGRETWTPETDPTRTVGWFTTMTPIHLSRAAIGDDIAANVVRHVKDARRRLPSNGWAYFASRYLTNKGRLAFESHESTSEVLFNYHGQFQQLEKEDGLFENISLDVPEEGTSLPASTLFNINVLFEGGTANYSFTYNRHIAHQGLINKWIDSIGTSLTIICESLASRDASRTLCDYEFLQLDYRGLDQLQSHMIPNIELTNKTRVKDVFPCSPMVDGTLLSQIRDPKSYKTSQTYEIECPRSGSPVNPDRLAPA
ncbi:nrps [Epichloe festucae Fl1]|uniref:Nrps n=1 Tax=Epichloe festucae (strain Fl1) TaxID=877507 RepID=A0A7S9PWT8_EPIFF|nr:nrps [Epichloe festucae Fl1]